MSCRCARYVKKGIEVGVKMLTGKRAEPQEAMRRFGICNGCSLVFHEKQKMYCGQPFNGKVRDEQLQGCGCPIDRKARLADEHCVLGKW